MALPARLARYQSMLDLLVDAALREMDAEAAQAEDAPQQTEAHDSSAAAAHVRALDSVPAPVNNSEDQR